MAGVEEEEETLEDRKLESCTGIKLKYASLVAGFDLGRLTIHADLSPELISIWLRIHSATRGIT